MAKLMACDFLAHTSKGLSALILTPLEVRATEGESQSSCPRRNAPTELIQSEAQPVAALTTRFDSIRRLRLASPTQVPRWRQPHKSPWEMSPAELSTNGWPRELWGGGGGRLDRHGFRSFWVVDVWLFLFILYFLGTDAFTRLLLWFLCTVKCCPLGNNLVHQDSYFHTLEWTFSFWRWF